MNKTCKNCALNKCDWARCHNNIAAIPFDKYGVCEDWEPRTIFDKGIYEPQHKKRKNVKSKPIYIDIIERTDWSD